MNTKVQSPISVITVFLWVGFVCAISFMEAWLKFRAPGITLPLGLGIGRLVFGTLNKVELFFALVLLIQLIPHERALSLNGIIYVIVISLLATQSLWILPALDARAEMYIQNIIPPPSNLHFYYVGADFIKVVCLSIYGITLFKTSRR